jgi:hypothetical protein
MMKMVENPIIKKRELPVVIVLVRTRPSSRLVASKENPVVNERYPGMSGKTHGEIKAKIPAANAKK